MTSVVGFTTSEMLNVFKRRERPVTMTFVRHKEWPRGENDLPDINMEILSNLFDKHDKSKIASLSAVALLNSSQFSTRAARMLQGFWDVSKRPAF